MFNSYANRLEWEKFAENETGDDFHQLFMRELLKDRKLEKFDSELIDQSDRYYKVKYIDRMNELEFMDESGDQANYK